MAKNTYSHKDVAGIDLVANIIDTFLVVADKPEQYQEGLQWYNVAHKFVLDLAQVYKLSIEQSAGIVAALSPQLSWSRNKKIALQFCAHMRQGNEEIVLRLGATGLNARKAIRIWHGEKPLDVLGGMKVISFYHNLLLFSSHVTIDRHAASIAMFGDNGKKSGSIALNDKLYVIIADAYRTAANIIAETWGVEFEAYTLQAIVWTQKAQSGGKA